MSVKHGPQPVRAERARIKAAEDRSMLTLAPCAAGAFDRGEYDEWIVGAQQRIARQVQPVEVRSAQRPGVTRLSQVWSPASEASVRWPCVTSETTVPSRSTGMPIEANPLTGKAFRDQAGGIGASLAGRSTWPRRRGARPKPRRWRPGRQPTT